MSRPTTKEPSFLDPSRLYSLKGFINDSGISPNRVRLAERAGIALPRLNCGRRVFIRGRDAIEFVERLAASGI